MKRIQTYSLIIVFSISFSLVYAQKNSVSSSPFTLQLEKDDINPNIRLEQKSEKNLVIFHISDKSGIDTVWFNDEFFLPGQSTSHTFVRPLEPITEYFISAVDIRGNKVIETCILNGKGVLLRGAQITKTSPDVYMINNAEYHALLIGVENYMDLSISDLDYPIDDVENLFTILTEQYTFDPENVQILKDPTENQIEIAFDMLKEQTNDNDNILIFFAGHGVWNESSEIGYWFPSDAKKDGSYSWVRNSTVRDYIKEINSRHTLLIADACFGGSILKTRGVEEEDIRAYNNLYSLKSRKAMTSGTLQKVPDKSVFMKYLLRQLSENKDSYLPAETLFSRFKLAVMNNSSNVPQYGVIMNAEDEGGDFIFIKRLPPDKK